MSKRKKTAAVEPPAHLDDAGKAKWRELWPIISDAKPSTRDTSTRFPVTANRGHDGRQPRRKCPAWGPW